MSQNDGEIFDNWFHLADKNRDGLVSGEEAREFFQRAQLSKETLFEVTAICYSFLLEGLGYLVHQGCLLCEVISSIIL